ncbi:hypothetical protein, partial [Actinomadura sp. NPDC000600]|uniref:hypothetical protein n=1 Tax=Actinomadura sp. NPDC000600 TaxID=3154262 RepID=UPI0033977E9F
MQVVGKTVGRRLAGVRVVVGSPVLVAGLPTVLRPRRRIVRSRTTVLPTRSGSLASPRGGSFAS